MNGLDAVGHVRLQLEKPFAIDHLAGHAVGLAAFQQIIHGREFVLVRGDDHLAHHAMRDPLLVAEILHHSLAGAAINGFEGVGFVVDAGMDDAGIATGLVISQRRLFFQDSDMPVGVPLADGAGRGQPDDAAANDEDISCCHRSNCSLIRSGRQR